MIYLIFQVFSIKISLAILSCGKLMDKLRYIFSQLTDCNGQLMLGRSDIFLFFTLSLLFMLFQSQ